LTFVCLSIPSWPTDAASSTELCRRALLISPRIRIDRAAGILWADGFGLDSHAMAEALVSMVGSAGIPTAAGMASTPIAAEVAVRVGGERIRIVPPGTDRDFLAPFDVGALRPPPPASLFPLLAGIGIESCRDLAALDPHSVEVRFGGEGVRIWKLARADDPRPIFGSRPRDLPNAELEWVDYELASHEHVVFIINSLLATVTDQLGRRHEGAHAMVLEFALADRSTVELPVRCSTPTAERKTWLRVIRALLEPVAFGAPVTRIALRVTAAAPLADRQGDLFDSGFATARATEAALAHLLDKQADAIVIPDRSNHPLPERRNTWKPEPSGQVAEPSLPGEGLQTDPPRLTIQLLPAPLPIEVWPITRRGQLIPDRYFDGARNYSLSASLGPDRVSGGFGEQRFDREYHQGVRHDGMMVLLYRDPAADAWFLAGWWD
jgi:hypothetical protein